MVWETSRMKIHHKVHHSERTPTKSTTVKQSDGLTEGVQSSWFPFILLQFFKRWNEHIYATYILYKLIQF